MLPRSLWLLCLTAISARAQSSDSSSTGSASSSSSSSSSASVTASVSVQVTTGVFGTDTISYSIIPASDVSTEAFTGSQFVYLTGTTQSSVASSSSIALISGSNATATTSSNSQITVSSLVPTLTEIAGGSSNATSGTATASSTSTSAQPTNTQACNNYPEFCNRKYSNITEVCAHNSAFAIKNNAASNQVLSITDQLNDGVRMLQGETHYVNDTIYNCHTSCSLLNAGTWQSELETLAAWVKDHPYDVVTFLIVNSDYVTVENYTAPIMNAGLGPYLYEPAYIPQHRDQWPTLAEMILSQKRVVFFMDYNANQTAVPYILDEFTHMWETPFSPTNDTFPCTQQRPPGLNQTVARDEYMYLANHNLNTDVDLSSLGISSEILIPNTVEINNTNGIYTTTGQLGAMTNSCQADWGRPPNFLLVDYYNYGDPGPGSVFEVAAYHNNVTYNRKCCGLATSAASAVNSPVMAAMSAALLAIMLLFA